MNPALWDLFYAKLMFMSIFTGILELSRTHCVSICGLLVPLGLLMTCGTLLQLGFRQPSWRIHLSAGLATGTASLMVLHVYSWWMMGVVMGPTYVLSFLAGLFLSLNGWALVHRHSLLQVVTFFSTGTQNFYRQYRQ
jgi:hypothetical protein